MANGVASALRLGAKYQRRNHGLEPTWGILRSTSEREGILRAEDLKLRLPKARSPLRLGGLGERRKLPQRGPGQSPRNRRDFEHFIPIWSTFWALVNLIFLNNQIEKIVPKPSRFLKNV